MEGQHRLAPGQISFQTVVEFLADVKTVRWRPLRCDWLALVSAGRRPDDVSSALQIKGRGSMKRKLHLVRRFMEAVVSRESGQAWDIWRIALPQVCTTWHCAGPCSAPRFLKATALPASAAGLASRRLHAEAPQVGAVLANGILFGREF